MAKKSSKNKQTKRNRIKIQYLAMNAETLNALVNAMSDYGIDSKDISQIIKNADKSYHQASPTSSNIIVEPITKKKKSNSKPKLFFVYDT